MNKKKTTSSQQVEKYKIKHAPNNIDVLKLKICVNEKMRLDLWGCNISMSSSDISHHDDLKIKLKNYNLTIASSCH